MKRIDYRDLIAFLTVAEEGSFTRAAAKLGTSQSSLSHTVRRLEERIGVRLLSRTTRNVSPTDAGEQLARSLRPSFDDIAAGIDEISTLKSRPSGTLRLTSSKNAAQKILLPVVSKLLSEHPDLNIEISIDQKLTDIVEERFDAGIRLGEQVEKDMIAVPISPPIRMAVVGVNSYFEKYGTPKTPYELTEHNCINYRMATYGGLYAWEFEKDNKEVNVRVEGQFICNDGDSIIQLAMDGVGLASMPEDLVLDHIETKKLVRVMEDWCPPFPGYHLYYPSRRQITPAFRLLIDALKYRG